MLLVSMLLENGANVNATNKSMETALHYSVRLERPDLVNILINHSATITIPVSSSGQSPLALASNAFNQNQNSGVVLKFLNHTLDLQEWLAEIKLEKYFMNFFSKGIFVARLGSLDHDTLEGIGIENKIDRQCILSESQKLYPYSYYFYFYLTNYNIKLFIIIIIIISLSFLF